MRKQNPVSLAALIIFLFLNIVSLFSRQITEALGLSVYALTLILDILCFILPAVLLAVKQRKEIPIKNYLRLRRFKIKYLPLSVSSGIAVTFLCVLINAVISMIFSPAPSTFEYDGWLSTAFAVVLIPAISEELFFRGAFASQFTDKLRPDVVFATAVTFTALHGSAENIITPFISSIVYSLLVYITDSVWPAVVAHAVNNLLAVFFSVYDEAIAASELKAVIYIAFLIVFFIFLYISLRYFEKFYNSLKKKKKKTVKEVRKRRMMTSPFNVCFFITVILFAVRVVFEAVGFWA